MFAILLLGFAQQPLDLLPSPSLALAVWEEPGATVRAARDGEVALRVRASGVVEELQRRPGFGMAALAWSAISAPVGGDAASFTDALLGRGVAAALIARPGAEPGLLVVARMGDPEAGAECLRQLARLAQLSIEPLEGESWEIPLGEAFLARAGEWLIFASRADDIATVRTRLAAFSADGAVAASAPALPPGALILRARATGGEFTPSLWVWLDGALLRANGHAPLPEDLGASLLGGDLHECLRVAEWAGATLRVDGGGLRAEFFAPEPAELGTTHAPFRPDVPAVSLPKIGGAMMRGVIVRDFGGWYNARDQYASAAAVAASVEGDGNLRLLFGRDFGPEVLAWLEPHARLLAARNPDAAARALELELPAAALGLQLRPGAPQGLAHGFVNAYLAAVTFANFQAGAADEQQLLLDLEKTADGGMLYLARRPALADGAAAPLAHNAEPALFVGSAGEIWISSSIGLLREIVGAPIEVVSAEASWAELDLSAFGPLLTSARGAIVARRLLVNGGDLAAAERFADLVASAAGLFDGAKLRFGPLEGGCGARLEVFAHGE
jgi:hypothetical protein